MWCRNVISRRNVRAHILPIHLPQHTTLPADDDASVLNYEGDTLDITFRTFCVHIIWVVVYVEQEKLHYASAKSMFRKAQLSWKGSIPAEVEAAIRVRDLFQTSISARLVLIKCVPYLLIYPTVNYCVPQSLNDTDLLDMLEAMFDE